MIWSLPSDLASNSAALANFFWAWASPGLSVNALAKNLAMGVAEMTRSSAIDRLLRRGLRGVDRLLDHADGIFAGAEVQARRADADDNLDRWAQDFRRLLVRYGNRGDVEVDAVILLGIELDDRLQSGLVVRRAP